MPMYKLTEYRDNCSKTCESLWQYCKDIPAVNNNDDVVEFNGANTTGSFSLKAKLAGQAGDNGTKEVEIMLPLKYLSNFWRTMEMPLINCESNLNLTWSVNRVIVYTNVSNQGVTFTITERYVPVVILSTEDNAKLLQQLKSGFKRISDWNKYLSKTELSAQNQNSNHLVEASFQGYLSI